MNLRFTTGGTPAPRVVCVYLLKTKTPLPSSLFPVLPVARMIDHILLLDEDETIGSVIQKVDSLNTARVAIVAGGNHSPLHNPLSVRLLERRARDRSMTVAVISDDEFTRWLCEEAGLRTYSTVEAFKGGMWSPTNRLTALLHSLPLNSWTSGAAGLAVLGVLLLVLYFVLPAATIVIAPTARSFPWM